GDLRRHLVVGPHRRDQVAHERLQPLGPYDTKPAHGRPPRSMPPKYLPRWESRSAALDSSDAWGTVIRRKTPQSAGWQTVIRRRMSLSMPHVGSDDAETSPPRPLHVITQGVPQREPLAEGRRQRALRPAPGV